MEQGIERTALMQVRILAESALDLDFSNGMRFKLSGENLRRNCPCASCREARGDLGHSKPIGGSSPSTADKRGRGKSSLRIVESSLAQELKITKVWAVGNYAIGILWGDGHGTGIYTYEELFKLCSALGEAA